MEGSFPSVQTIFAIQLKIQRSDLQAHVAGRYGRRRVSFFNPKMLQCGGSSGKTRASDLVQHLFWEVEQSGVVKVMDERMLACIQETHKEIERLHAPCDF